MGGGWFRDWVYMWPTPWMFGSRLEHTPSAPYYLKETSVNLFNSNQGLSFLVPEHSKAWFTASSKPEIFEHLTARYRWVLFKNMFGMQ